MRVVVDRIEGKYAVLLYGEKEIKVDMPLELLPEGTREGSILQGNFELDLNAEQQQREKVSKLLEKLKNKNR